MASGERPGAGDGRDRVGHLCGELAGRHQDECRGAPVGGLDTLDKRHAEGERLARTGRRLDEHVVAVQGIWNDRLLHGEGTSGAALGECVRDSARHAELGEGLLGHRYSLRKPPVSAA